MNRLYYGDNLDILRNYISDESVDLIYIDPPFNSNQAYNVIFSEANGSASQAQIRAFGDTWHWGESTEQAYQELIETAPHRLVETIKSFRGFLTETNLMAYLVMMALRLVELHRVLKPTGSFYLHCDPTASHYLRILMDVIFEPTNFRNEIVWKRTSAHNDPKRYGRIHDVLLYYAKEAKQVFFSPVYTDYRPEYLKSEFKQDSDGHWYKLEDLTAPYRGGSSGRFEFHGRIPGPTRMWRLNEDEMGKLWQAGRIKKGKDGKPLLRGQIVYLKEKKGMPVQDWWDDILRVGNTSRERLGYPTQKPETLLERIILASSNEGDVVLDAFCGCGTAIAVAQRLNRRWIGIDITHLAIALLKYRLSDAFGDEAKYEVTGEPKDEASALALAQQDRYQFQWWALSLIKARPYQGKKKGADEGVDGVIYFQDVAPEKPKKKITQKIVVQVKSGKVGLKDIKELRTTVDNQKAVIGVFITLQPPTKPMIREAAKAGMFQRFSAKYPKTQIRTIKELLEGHGIEYPQTPLDLTFKRATRQEKAETQLELI